MADIHIEQGKQARNAYLAWIVVVVLLVAAALVYYFASRDKTGDPVIAPADNISFRVNLPAMAAGQVLIIA